MLTEIAVSVVGAYLLAQVIKLLIGSVQAKKLEWKVLALPGGIPSVHSTSVTSLVMALYLDQGITPLVFVSLVFGIIVMYDAMTLRREVGFHTGLIARLHLKIEKKEMKSLLNEKNVGHTPIEVLVGIIVGVLTPLVVFLLW